MNHSYTRKWNRVTLNPLERSEIETLRNWRNDVEANPYLTQMPFITKEMQEQWFDHYLEDNNCITMAAYYEQKLIGAVSLYNFNDTAAEFGKLMIGKLFRGGGWATMLPRRALKSVIRIWG